MINSINHRGNSLKKLKTLTWQKSISVIMYFMRHNLNEYHLQNSK